MNRKLSAGFIGWVATWEEKRRKMQSMRRGLGHMLNRKLSMCFETWLVYHRDVLGVERFYLRVEDTPALEELLSSPPRT